MIIDCGHWMPDIQPDASASDLLNYAFKNFIQENGKPPLYFVINPLEYSKLIAALLSEKAVLNGFENIFGVPILVNQIVPVGESKFVG